MRGLAALTPSRRCLLTIVGEIPGPLLGTVTRRLMRAAVAGLAALTACFGGAFAVIGEIAGAMLPANVTSARGLFAIFREIPWVSRMLCVSHCLISSLSSKVPDRSIR
jgi:hypothetical protein